MAKKIAVDPITRIEGHLRIEAQIDGGRITDAWSSSTAFRGIETILKGRDPRDAHHFVQRFCGVCTASITPTPQWTSRPRSASIRLSSSSRCRSLSD